MTMKRVNVSTLSGWPLRWAVAKATKRAVFVGGGRVLASNRKGEVEYLPDESAEQYELLAFRHGVKVLQDGGAFWASAQGGRVKEVAKSQGVAVCRAVVAIHAGSTICVPDHLLQ